MGTPVAKLFTPTPLLGVLLGIAVLTIIAALVIDAMNPNIGFFWLTE